MYKQMSLIHFKTKNGNDPDFGSNERVFVEQYDWMIQSATNLTRGQRERAEDLVHDAFVQFQVKQQNLAEIENLRGYLYAVLRNLYVSQIRRISRYPIQQLSILDHDSAVAGLRDRDFRDQLQAMSQLVKACEFACYRKETAGTASIFILRYFHGYYPDEIARLLGTERSKVDKWLARGRSEAKSYLADPYTLPRRNGNSKGPNGTEIENPAFFLGRFRSTIFESCTSPCAEAKQGGALVEITIGTANLAHLVSCPSCLDRRSKHRGLPGLGERALDDSHTRDDRKLPPEDGGGEAGSRTMSSPGASAKRSKSDRLRQIRGRTKDVLTHQPSEISIAVDGYIRTSHVIKSGDNVLSLALDNKEQPEFVEILSGHGVRFLLLDCLDLSSTSPRHYQIPLDGGRSLEVEVIPDVHGPCIQVAYSEPGFESQAAEQDRSSFDDAVVFGAEIVLEPNESWLRRLWSKIAGKLHRRGIRVMSPLLAAALVFGLASIVCFLFWLQKGPSTTPEALLERAARWDRTAAQGAEAGVVYQKVRIRTAKRTFERPIYRDPRGLRTSKRQQADQDEARLEAELAIAGVNWEQPLSAVNYRNWHDRQHVEKDVLMRSDGNLLLLTTTVSGGAVAAESLTVRESDFHPVARTVTFRDSETVEIAELTYDVLPWSAVNGRSFEPLPAAPAVRLSSSSLPMRLTDAQADEAELQARLVLNQVHADTSERIEIRRGVAAVHVEGIVATEARKREISRYLSQVPHIASAIRSFQELKSQLSAGTDAANIQQVTSTPQTSPLEEYLLPKGISQDEIRETGHRLFNSSAAVSQEGNALHDLLLRFPSERISDPGRVALNKLLAAHRERLLAALQTEEQILAKMEIPSEPTTDDSADIDLHAATQRHLRLCTELLSGNDGTSRNAQRIVPELAQSIGALRTLALRARVGSTVSQTVP